ncbi:MAG: serine--tRNA ligase [Deltaproteobacteria bacterium]|jgi:seryl-tRNA synthetase|nr:serine--tRNA ligase [Deltaproteobacteria bacterium]
MLDLKLVRDNPRAVLGMLEARGQSPELLDGFGELDARRRSLLKEIEDLKAARNSASDEVARLKKDGGPVPEGMIAENREISQKIKLLDPEVARVEEQERALLASFPNIPDGSVPVGDETANKETRTWGVAPKFKFAPKNHWELGEGLGLMDFGRAAKIAGSRFVVLHDQLARLNRALIDFMLDLHTLRHGYREVWPPALVNSQSLFGTGQLPKFAEDLFKMENSDLWLAPTAEVQLTNLFRNETVDLEDGPVAVTAYTPCFRAEAGAAGRDTRGMIRMHQFDKVELVKVTRPEDSFDQLEKLTRDAEEVLQQLGLAYRVVLLATGDMGFSSAKTYDLEVWLPGPGTYREISSCSCFTDFQARRANIKFRRGKGGRTEFAHTLNGSGLAVGRTMVAVLENYQQEDGTVLVPEVLRPRLGGLEVLGTLK